MNTYLIPANTKKGTLILGIFRPFDLILSGAGVLITLILLLIMPMGSTGQVILVILPAAIATFLIVPVPHYHNILTIIVEGYTFFTNRQKYIWKGWCVKDVKDVKASK